ncbi:MAG: hypothetical protein E7253_08995 [Lachnospiraceae bacterium]|nr:hypothetical protein [Lachnospiraceae bacterium]
MPNSKQKVRDRDYYGEYQKKSCYNVDQWIKIISNEAFVSPTELSILKEIFLSANHAASLSQLGFRHKKDPSYFVVKMNQLASNIGRPNGYSVDVDLDGNEYWWYLLFWGKNTKLAGLEWKLLPELAEAIEYLYPELEDQYNSYMSEIERSEQIRYTKEDSVWIASTLLLFEKVYLEHPTDIYDLLLMQYEVSQRSQKIYGQDVDVDIITDNCNADSSRCVFPYLRDIDKYWRVCYPGELEDAVLRPEKIDYNAYVPSKFGFVKIKELCEFLETDYCKLTDPNYIEIDESNPFYKMINFIKENGRRRYMDLTAPTEEDIERFLNQKERSKEALNEFHSLGRILTLQYPSFTQTEQASWLERDNTTIKSCWIDSYELKDYKGFGPTFSILCGQNDDQKGKIIFSVLLNFPIESAELTEKIMEKCGNLTVLTSANFKVEKSIRMDTIYSAAFGNSILAYTSFEEQAVLEESLQDVTSKFETAIQILASYYLDIIESVYAPAQKTEEETVAALDTQSENTPSPASTTGTSGETNSIPISAVSESVTKRRTPMQSHEDRKDSSFTLYPKNILIQGPSGCGKLEQAVRICIGIIEGSPLKDIQNESYMEILKRFGTYQEEGRILFTGGTGISFEDWMEGPYGEGRFVTFTNQITSGRYVCLIEDFSADNIKNVMKDAFCLLAPEKREGQPAYVRTELPGSLQPYSLPSNLFLIGITDSSLSSLKIDSINPIFHIQHMSCQDDYWMNLDLDGLNINTMLHTMNQRLAYFIGSEYQIGHKLFDDLKSDKSLHSLGTIMYGKILPLLHHFFVTAGYKDPYEGLYFIFGDFKKSKPEYELIQKETMNPDEIFGKDLNFTEKTVYRIQKSAFFELNSYLEL